MPACWNVPLGPARRVGAGLRAHPLLISTWAPIPMERSRVAAPSQPALLFLIVFRLGAAVVGKQSDAKRKAKLKDRRKKAEAALARVVGTQSKVAEWAASFDAEPNIIAELVDEHGAVLAYVEGDDDENWTVVVDDEPVAGTSDEFVALSLFLGAAVDDRAAGNTSFIQFGTWLIEEIERRCEANNMEWHDFLRALLPLEKQHLALPHQRAL